MNPEYDFSRAERGKFFKENARFNIPVYLDADVRAALELLAASKGVSLKEIVNELLKKRLAEIEASGL